MPPTTMTATTSSSPADLLRHTCMCAICLNLLGLPCAWSCGHSFCKSCSCEWISTSLAEREASSTVRCPTCRKDEKVSSVRRFGVNVALRALLISQFPKEAAKREAVVMEEFDRMFRKMKKATGAENGGAHEEGYELFKEIEGFVVCGEKVRGNRNVVRDEDDYVMTVALAPLIEGLLPVSRADLMNWKPTFVMLQMEEDEAESGFPACIDEENDYATRKDLELLRDSSSDSELQATVSINGVAQQSISGELDGGRVSFELGKLIFRHLKSVPTDASFSLRVADEIKGLYYELIIETLDGPRKFNVRSVRGKKDDADKNDEEDYQEDELESDAEESGEEDSSSLDGFIERDEENVDEDEDDEFEDSSIQRTKKKRSGNASNTISLLDSSSDSGESHEDETPLVKKQKRPIVIDSDMDDDDEEVEEEEYALRKQKKKRLRAAAESEEEDDIDDSFDEDGSISDDDHPTKGRAAVEKDSFDDSEDDDFEDDDEEEM